MKSYSFQFALLLAGLGVANIVTTGTASAQSITPANDGTGTTVQQNGTTLDINGGTLSGTGNQQNLFHSFQKFGLTQGEIANFLSNPNIQNILGRVTGGDASIINGLIKITDGNSNLFLMNPAGIVFGNNASLNIPASFTATTATGIGFGNNLWFNATGTNNYSTLVGTPTSFLFNTNSSGSIVNSGNLELATGQNLSLLGGTTVNTGNLKAPDGNVIIASVPGENLLRISQPGNVLSLDVVPPTSGNGTALPFKTLSLPALLTGKTGLVNGLMVTADGKGVLTNSGTVVADVAGNSTVAGKINVSGQTGGNVNFLASNSVTFDGTIDAGVKNVTFNSPTVNLNAPIKPTPMTTPIPQLSGTATTVNVGAKGTVQDGVDVAAAGGKVNLAPATYTLGSTVNIGKNLTVTGSGANKTTVDGNNAVRVFNISSGNVTLDGLTITKGNAGVGGGGGISSGAGILNVNNSIINNNTAYQGAGINFTNGTVNITNSTISNNTATSDVGGILMEFFPGTLNITNSTVSNNTALIDNAGYSGNVGGIANFGTTTITNSTISNNQAVRSGGGIYNNGTTTITNSTITQNTNTNNAGGVYNNSGTINIKNTIIAGNNNTTAPDVGGVFADQGNNLIGKKDGSTGFTNGVNGSIVGTIANPNDPKLGALADNGGATKTHALLAGSAAIDAGDPNSTLTFDQRGGQRGGATNGGLGAGTKIDIGAYEATSFYVVTNTKDDNNVGSFRAAINFANVNVNPVRTQSQNTISFNIPDSGIKTIAPTSALPNIIKPVIIDGYTQPGSTPNTLQTGNNAKLNIELNGAKAGAVDGLTLATGSDGSTIKGLAINSFGKSGIVLKSNNNSIQGNFIGTAADGTTALGNTSNGLTIAGGVSKNTIGGKEANTGNIIAFNAKGVVVEDNTSIGNQILGNSIFGNKGIGIDLNNDGPSINGTTKQNYPILLSASDKTVIGILNSAANTTYRLEFFSSATSNEGKTLIGTTDVTTDAQGIAKFKATVTGILEGKKVTATATSETRGTSEFSPVAKNDFEAPNDFKYSLFFYPQYAHYFKGHHLHLNNSIFLRSLSFRSVAFLSFNDVGLTKFNIFLPDIAAYMNSGGGTLTVNINDILGAEYDQLMSSVENQIVVKRHLMSLVRQSIGVEYISLVNIDVKTVKSKCVAYIKIKQSTKPVKFKKDKKDKKESYYVRKGDKTVLFGDEDDNKKGRDEKKKGRKDD